MKIVGITGRAGSGKTTLSNILAENKNVRVMHLDYLLDKVKNNKLLKNITVEKGRRENRNQYDPRLLKDGMSNFIYNHSIILRIYLSLKRKMKSRILKKTIEKYSDAEILIIEGFDLLNFDISKELDLLIFVKVPYHERINRLSKRNECTNKKRLIEIDRNLQKNLRGKNKVIPDYIVDNNLDIENLKKESKIILKKLEQKTISPSEKFRKENRVLRSKTKKSSNLIKNNEERRIENNDKEIYED